MSARRTKLLPFAMIFAGLLPSASLAGTVITDGSLGRATTLTGPNFSIPASLGQVRGANLFQSFQTLNLSAGDVAKFSGPSTVTNVLARVTGGQSNINGTLACSIPRANFYLIDSSGVVFGSSASLDIQGSFTVTTADEIKFSDGHAFAKAGVSDTALTSAAPAAFGFLAKHPAAITMNGSLLRVPTKQSITVAAGPLQLANTATLRASAGAIGVLSVDGPATAAIVLGSAPTPPSAASLADVSLVGASAFDTTGVGGGKIAIIASDLSLTASGLNAQTRGLVAGGGIDLQVAGKLESSAGYIFTNTSGGGAAGDISIHAKVTDADDGSVPQAAGIHAEALPGSTGIAGAIIIHATQLSLTQGQDVDANTYGAGRGGDLTVVAQHVTLDGAASSDPNNFSGFFAESRGAADGGAIRVHSGNLTVSDGASINSSTVSKGSAGDIAVVTNGLTINGQSSNSPTSITSEAEPGSGGAAGNVSVRATTTELVSGGAILSDTNAQGHGGDVTFSGDQLTIDGRGNSRSTGLFSSADAGTGAAGNVSVDVKSASVVAGGQISSSTFAAGNAGKVTIVTGQLKVDGRGSHSLAGIGSQADAGSTGAAGDTSVDASVVNILAGGEILSDTHASGRGGDVTLTGSQLAIDGRGSNLATGVFSNTDAGIGAAGDVSVDVSSASIVAAGEIGSNTSAAGSAGRVSLIVGQLKVDGRGSHSFTGITSQAVVGSTGAAGGTSVDAAVINILAGGEILSDTHASGRGGDVTLTSGQLAIDGRGSNSPTGVFSNTDSGTGAAGAVAVDVRSASLVAGGQIRSDSSTMGHAGEISVVAGQLKLDGRGRDVYTVISSTADASGSAGSVRVHAIDLNVLNSAHISSDSQVDSTGNAGDVSITAHQITVLGTDENGSYGYISSEADGSNSGAGGNVSIHSKKLIVGPGGQIDTDTSSAQKAGDLSLDVDELFVGGKAKHGNDGFIASDAFAGSGGAGSIAIQANSIVVSGGGLISSDTYTSGHGGTVAIKTSSLSISGADSEGDDSYISSDADTGSTGAAGALTLTANAVSVLNGGFLSSSTYGSGSGGDLSVNTSGLRVSGADGFGDYSGIRSSAEAGSTGAAGRVSVTATSIKIHKGSFIDSETSGPGDGGAVSINTHDVSVMSGGEIASDTFAEGDAGSVSLTADQLTLDGRGTSSFTGISSDADVGSTGSAGTVAVHANSTSVLAGGQISSSTSGSGNAGEISVVSGQLKLDGRDSHSLTGVSSQAYAGSSGSAGDVSVQATAASLRAGGELISDTHGEGDGGDVAVTAGQLQLDGAGNSTSTLIAASADPGSTGSAGSVKISAHGVTLSTGGFVASSAYAAGDGGDVMVNANALTIGGANQTSISGIYAAAYMKSRAGEIDLNVGGLLSLSDDGKISTTATEGTGGDVGISAGRLRLNGSSITTSAARVGGNITLDAQSVTLAHGSAIVAASSGTAAGDNGGNIVIGKTVLSFLPHLHTGVISANAGLKGQGFGGNITVAPGGEVLAPLGVNAKSEFTATGSKPGTVNIESPDVDLTGEVAPLIAAAVQTDLSLSPVCSMQVGPDQSSFTLEGGNGIPLDPENETPAGFGPTTRPARR